ncbi:MAG: N-6 DNA methylase, partial [bacterium]
MDFKNNKRVCKESGIVRDVGISYLAQAKKRRDFGEHLTSVEIFKRYIFPEIKNFLYDYSWVDLFAGEGNLILPILDSIPPSKRVNFFKNHIFLFDVQREMVAKSIANAKCYGIPDALARQNIALSDTLKEFPTMLKKLKHPIYHITNPPYLYLGYIVKNSGRNLQYFTGNNAGYQDLYQIALINDLRNKIDNLIYIIPTNFLFGFSVSNKIRNDFLQFYSIKKAI